MMLLTKGKKRRVCWQHGKLFRKGKCPVCRQITLLRRAADVEFDEAAKRARSRKLHA